MFLLLYRVANQVLMRPDEYKAVFRKAVFRWYTSTRQVDCLVLVFFYFNAAAMKFEN